MILMDSLGPPSTFRISYEEENNYSKDCLPCEAFFVPQKKQGCLLPWELELSCLEQSKLQGSMATWLSQSGCHLINNKKFKI